jgi:hypothetical protein
MMMKAERKRERKRERSGKYGKGPRNPRPFLWLVLCSFFGRKNKKRKNLISSLAFFLIREKETSDIHTEKFHPPTNALKW